MARIIETDLGPKIEGYNGPRTWVTRASSNPTVTATEVLNAIEGFSESCGFSPDEIEILWNSQFILLAPLNRTT